MQSTGSLKSATTKNDFFKQSTESNHREHLSCKHLKTKDLNQAIRVQRGSKQAMDEPKSAHYDVLLSKHYHATQGWNAKSTLQDMNLVSDGVRDVKSE